MQSYFNSREFHQRAQEGEFIVEVHDEYHPKSIQHEPFCTWSRTYRYLTQDREPVALVHQYDRPDGTIGASGKPDPKSLVVAGEVWGCRSEPKGTA